MSKWVELGHDSNGPEQRAFMGALFGMDGPQKLRSLARQSRALACMISDRKRAEALQALGRLYEKQADDLEAREPA